MLPPEKFDINSVELALVLMMPPSLVIGIEMPPLPWMVPLLELMRVPAPPMPPPLRLIMPEFVMPPLGRRLWQALPTT